MLCAVSDPLYSQPSVFAVSDHPLIARSEEYLCNSRVAVAVRGDLYPFISNALAVTAIASTAIDFIDAAIAAIDDRRLPSSHLPLDPKAHNGGTDFSNLISKGLNDAGVKLLKILSLSIDAVFGSPDLLLWISVYSKAYTVRLQKVSISVCETNIIKY
ncbi:hypothetical protein C8R45DRAFT_1108978 [Mycena sanguinolenta]|nr:hypothetical protein C8R45DRAFT_1108978 [Mycena sanguinolenta]